MEQKFDMYQSIVHMHALAGIKTEPSLHVKMHATTTSNRHQLPLWVGCNVFGLCNVELQLRCCP